MDALNDSAQYVDVVMSQQSRLTNEQDSCEPSAAKKAKTSSCENDPDATTDVNTIDNVELLAAIKTMHVSFSEQLNLLEVRVTAKLTETFRAETMQIRKEFDAQVKALTDKVKHLEVKGDNLQRSVSEQVKRLETKIGNNSRSSEKTQCNVVIRNLPVTRREAEDNTVLCNSVNQLFRDGLRLGDVRAVNTQRKQRTDSKPGIVIATMESAQQKIQLLQNKKHLKTSKEFSRIYIDNALTQDELTARSNLQTLIKEVGKNKMFRFHGKRLVLAKNKE